MNSNALQLLTPEDLVALLETSDELNRTRPLRDVLHTILSLAGRLIHSGAGSVMLYDPERDDLYFAAATGPAAEAVLDKRVPIGTRAEPKSKAGAVFLTGQPIVEDRLKEHYEGIDQTTNFHTRSMVCIPLVHERRTLGVMQLLNKARSLGSKRTEDVYTPRDVELLSRFGVQATLSIRNAALLEQMLGSSGLHARHAVREDIASRMLSPEPFAIAEHLTVLSADMRGFSRLCTGFTPQQIQAMLGDYIAILASLVVHHDGIVNKVIGDGIVALFRGADGPAHAIAAALDMVEQFHQLRTRWAEGVSFNLDFVDIGVGIASSPQMIIGTVGDDRFRDVTVIGEAVNLASWLVDDARNGRRILCDKRTWLGARSTGIAQAKGPTEMKPIKTIGPQSATYDIYDLTRTPVTAEGTLAVAGTPAARSPAARAPATAAPGQYHAIISYRREGGSEIARLVQQGLLLQFKLRVFLDVDSMPAGPFDESLLKIVAETPNFIVILSKGALDRVHAPEDWLRREIAQALKSGANIVPVKLPEFEFPDSRSLPEEIRDFMRCDAIAYDRIYYGPTLEKLRGHLKLEA